MKPSAVVSGVLSDPNGIGRISLAPETFCLRSSEEGQQSVGTGGEFGKANGGYGSLESGLGGMADGIPKEMDGRILWRTEPEEVPRMTENTEGRALRLKTLGNAVCPP